MNRVQIHRFAPLSYPVQEALNALCTNLSFAGENIRKIMITSSHASEGKSFVAMNLMRTMAKYGKRVALVDADLRRSCIAPQFGLCFENQEASPGLSHLLAGMADESQVIYATDIEGAFIVPIGQEVANPLPLLNSKRFSDLLDHLTQTADYVLVDAPPIGAVIDAAEIARACDGTLLVVRYNEVHRQELIDAQQQLEQTSCPILGTVLNDVDRDSFINRKYYYKAYDSHYGPYNASDRRSKRKVPRRKGAAEKERL